MVVYSLFVPVLWTQAAGPDGQGLTRRVLIPGRGSARLPGLPAAACPTRRYQQRLARSCCSAPIGASAWNLIGGYAGQVSVGHVVFFGAGAYAAIAVYTHFGLPPIAGLPSVSR